MLSGPSADFEFRHLEGARVEAAQAAIRLLRFLLLTVNQQRILGATHSSLEPYLAARANFLTVTASNIEI